MRSRSPLHKDTDDWAETPAMTWRDFERLIVEGFQARGFTVTGFGGYSAGGDLALTRNGQRYLAQCRHWRKHEVGAAAIRELGQMLLTVGAHGGYLITTGRFTRDARELALMLRIELVAGEALGEWTRAVEKA